MGAWGVGNFENDDAGDWVWELEKSKDKRLLHKTLARVTEVDEPDAPECSEALAAAEIVLAGLTKDHSQVPEEARNWLTAKTGLLFRKSKEFGASDAQLACAAVEQVLANSELVELWKESDEYHSWRSAQENLLNRLQSHS